MTAIAQRLDHIRQQLHAHQVRGVLVLSSDPHMSEYLPEHWQVRQWASGFTGSMGSLVILQDKAALFVDSRYWTQAEQELQHSGIEVIKLGQPNAPSHIQWLEQQLHRGDTLAVDGRTLSVKSQEQLQQQLSPFGIQLRTDIDAAGHAWTDRPALSLAPIREHLPPHACVTRQAKIDTLRQALSRHSATHHLISTLDDIAWLLNLRGQDVDYNPVFLAHVLLSASEVTLFIDPLKVPQPLQQRLQDQGVNCRPYDSIVESLAQLPSTATILLDPRRVAWSLRQAIPTTVAIAETINPSVLHKSRKTDQEAEHIRRVMERDAAAMANFYAWFESALGHTLITELTIDEMLTQERAKQPEFQGLSFPTIAGFNANGALPHYRATAQSHATISTPQGIVEPGLLLIDSGGQYLGGTTDITRVWAIGTPTDAQKRDFTLVLKGMIQLSRARFPEGTLSPMLDALARTPLWEHGLDFGHGTGHGVGYFLNVHEGPQSISKAVPEPHMAMRKGMITSNEPGLYRPGQWGIRIENLVLNVSSPEQEMGDFLAFETLTLCPIDRKCIELALLRPDEIKWLNQYHQQVWDRVHPLTTGQATQWLEKYCRPLSLN